MPTQERKRSPPSNKYVPGYRYFIKTVPIKILKRFIETTKKDAVPTKQAVYCYLENKHFIKISTLMCPAN